MPTSSLIAIRERHVAIGNEIATLAAQVAAGDLDHLDALQELRAERTTLAAQLPTEPADLRELDEAARRQREGFGLYIATADGVIDGHQRISAGQVFEYPRAEFQRLKNLPFPMWFEPAEPEDAPVEPLLA